MSNPAIPATDDPAMSDKVVGQFPAKLLDEPFFIPDRNVLLLPATPEWHDLPRVTWFKRVTISGRKLYACRNNPALNQLLFSAGYDVPSPLIYDKLFDWSGQSVFMSQQQTSAMMVCRRRAYILNQMGTGKTLATLLALDWLILQKIIRRALVIAPLTTLQPVWEAEIYSRVSRLDPVLLTGSRKQRLAGLQGSGWNVALINPEGVRVVRAELHHAGFQALVLDELAMYRERTTERWRLTEALVKKMDFAWGLTGAPMPNGPWDAYGQIKLLTPWEVPISFKRFRDDVATEPYPGKWKPRKGAEAYVFRRMQPAIRFLRSEVIELPPSQTITRQVRLSSEQEAMAKVLIKDMIVKHQEGMVKAVNAAVLVGKLLQVYSGAVYTDKREVIDLHAKNRLDTTREIMDSAEGKVIIFVPFRFLCDMLPAQLGVPASSIRMVRGGVPDSVRTIIFQDFQDRNSPVKYLVAHPKCMAHGLNLSQANVIVWYAPFMSNEVVAQANDRITRMGQEREQLIVRLSGSPTETRLYRTNDQRGSMQDAALGLFESKFE